MTFPWNAYRDRIGLTDDVAPDLAGLFALHRAQFHAIAFENLNIQLGRGVDLAPEALCTRLIDGRRGGYCFELNGLMLMALRHLGYEARPLLARVHLSTPPGGRTHQLNAVDIDGETWLMDVGFGAGGPRQPLLLTDGWEARGDFWGFRIEQREPWGWLMSSWEGGAWRDSYSFDLGHVTPQDIAVSNFFTSHSPDTPFTRMRVVSLPTVDGRVSLMNQELTRLAGDRKTVTEVPAGTATMRLLAEEFGLRVDADFADFRPVAGG